MRKKSSYALPWWERGSVFNWVQKPHWTGSWLSYTSTKEARDHATSKMSFTLNEWHDFECYLEGWQDMGNLGGYGLKFF